MQRINTVSEGIQKFKDLVAKQGFEMIAKGDTKQGFVAATIWVAQRRRKNDYDMLWAIENYDGVIVRRGESQAFDIKVRIDDAMKNAGEVLLNRSEARAAIKRGALH
jgi:hypothetical protein